MQANSIEELLHVMNQKIDEVLALGALPPRKNYCGKNLHDLSVPGSRNKAGKCRLCRNRYIREYRANTENGLTAGGQRKAREEVILNSLATCSPASPASKVTS